MEHLGQNTIPVPMILGHDFVSYYVSDFQPRNVINGEDHVV